MKDRLARILGLAMAAVCAWTANGAQTNLIYFDIGDYGQTVEANVNVTITLISPNSRVEDGIFIRRDAMTAATSANGRAFFTNLLWGYYRVDVAGRAGTTFYLNVWTNTTGTVNAGTLRTNAAALPPDPSTNYYTIPQVDLLIAGIDTSGGTATNVLQVGTTNSSGIIVGTNSLNRDLALDTSKPMAYAAVSGSVTGTVDVATYAASSGTVTGTVAVASYATTAATATNMDASGITSGTLDDDRLSANIARVDLVVTRTDGVSTNQTLWTANPSGGAGVIGGQIGDAFAFANHATRLLLAVTPHTVAFYTNAHFFQDVYITNGILYLGNGAQAVIVSNTATATEFTKNGEKIMELQSDKVGVDKPINSITPATNTFAGTLVATQFVGGNFIGSGAGLTDLPAFDVNTPVAYATQAGSVTSAVNVATAATYSSLATNAVLTNAIGTVGNLVGANLYANASGASNTTSYVDVKREFGAVDGEDCTVRLQAAISRAGTNGTVLFPPSTNGYWVSAALVPMPGQTWSGYGAVLKRAAGVLTTTDTAVSIGAGPTTITVASTNGLRVGQQVNLFTRTNGVQETWNATVLTIAAITGSDLSLAGAISTAFPTGAVVTSCSKLVSSATARSDNVQLVGFTFDGNTANNNTNLNYWNLNSDVEIYGDNTLVRDCRFINSTADSLYLVGRNIRVMGCAISNALGNGIHLGTTDGTIISGNNITRCNTDMRVGHTDGAIAASDAVTNTIISGNVIAESLAGIGGWDQVDNVKLVAVGNVISNCVTAIAFESAASELLFADNIVENSGRVSINTSREVSVLNNRLRKTYLYLPGLTNGLVSGNYVSDVPATNYAISLTSPSGVRVEGNTLIGGSSGIYCNGSVDRLMLRGNVLHNQLTNGILLNILAGTTNLVLDGNIITFAGTNTDYIGIHALNAGPGGIYRNNVLSLSGNTGGYGIYVATAGGLYEGNVIRLPLNRMALVHMGGSSGVRLVNNRWPTYASRAQIVTPTDFMEWGNASLDEPINPMLVSPTNAAVPGCLIVSNAATIGGNLTALGTSNNIGGLIVTNGGAYVPSLNSTTGSLSSASIGAFSFTGSPFYQWQGPTNTLTLSNYLAAEYYFTLTNNAAITNFDGIIGAGVHRANLNLTNPTSSNVTFSVSAAAAKIFGGMTNTVITIPSTNAAVVAVKMSTNASLNITMVAAGISSN